MSHPRNVPALRDAVERNENWPMKTCPCRNCTVGGHSGARRRLGGERGQSQRETGPSGQRQARGILEWV
jgi:hypothetical protein